MNETQIRDRLHAVAADAPAPTTVPRTVLRRARARVALTVGASVAIVVAVITGSAVGLRELAAPEPRPATPPPSPATLDSLAYGVDGDIYVAESDGSNAVRIADGRSVSECGGNGEYWAGPIWSPDGRYLAYRHQNCPLRSEEDPSGVVISDPEGNVVAEVPSAEFGQNLGGWRISWSPDSTRFAAWVTVVDVAAPDGTKLPVGETIGVFGLDGARHALLSVRPFLEFFDADLMWPGGETLLVGDVVVPIDGRTPYRLQLDGSPSSGVTYSPDGSRLAYVHEVDAPGQNRLVVEGDPSGPQAVFVGAEGGVVWSPAGDRIAFTSRKAGTDHLNELRVVDLDTGTVTLVADWSDREPEYFQTLSPLDFSPEGDRILFGVREGKGSLWSVNVDGSDLRRLVAGTYWGDWPPGPVVEGTEPEPTATAESSTTENGQPIVLSYTSSDGEVTVSAPSTWKWWGPGAAHVAGEGVWFGGLWRPEDHFGSGERVEFVDPVAYDSWCEANGGSPLLSAPAGATAIAQQVIADRNFETTAPVAVRVGGVKAVSIDAALAPGGRTCGVQMIEISRWVHSLEPGWRLRLYLVDLPEGMSVRTLAITVVAPEERFDEFIEETAPIIESIDFHPGD